MNDDRFTNISKDIQKSIGKILSSKEMDDLKNTIFSVINEVEEAAHKVGNSAEKKQQEKSEKYYEKQYKQFEKEEKKNFSNTFNEYNSRFTNQKNIDERKNTQLAVQKYKIKGNASSILQIVLGSVFGAVTMFASLGLWVSKIVTGISSFGIASFVLAVVTAGLAGLTTKGILGQIKISRYKKYLKQINSEPMYTIKELSEKTGIELEKVKKDLPKFIKSVKFPFAQLDEQQTCLILEQETYNQYLELKESRKRFAEEEAERKAKIANNPELAAVEKMRTEGIEYLHKIRLINDALPEEEISNKLDKLESICRKIFDFVEKNPQKLPQIRKFMCYYLPTTLKLVEAYEQLERHQISTASIEDSKKEIHSTIDNINIAFENLFDKLLQNDLMDISADISVLETMLAQEGLTNNSKINTEE